MSELISPEAHVTGSSPSHCIHHLRCQWSSLGCSGANCRMNEPQRHPTISNGTDINNIYKVVNKSVRRRQWSNGAEGNSHFSCCHWICLWRDLKIMYSVIRAPEHEEAMVPRFDLEWQKQNAQSRLLHLMSRIIMSEVKQFMDRVSFLHS